MTYITRNFLVTGGPGAEHSLLGQVQMSTNFDKQHFTVCDHLLINIIELLLNIGSPKVAHSQVYFNSSAKFVIIFILFFEIWSGSFVLCKKLHIAFWQELVFKLDVVLPAVTCFSVIHAVTRLDHHLSYYILQPKSWYSRLLLLSLFHLLAHLQPRPWKRKICNFHLMAKFGKCQQSLNTCKILQHILLSTKCCPQDG